MIPSFGPFVLLSNFPDPMTSLLDMKEAYVDTGSSLKTTPFRDDFINYTLIKGTIMKGLSTGANIAGRGTIHWKLGIGNKVRDLQLRALYVLSTEHRLLWP